MALNAAALGSELETAVRSSQSLDATPYPQLTAYCNAIAQAIVDHIVNNAELNMAQANGFTEEVETVGPNINKSEIINVPVTGGIL